MTATNRGAERVEEDAYLTPSWAVRRLLEAVDLPRGRWLEPCAGDGAIVKVVQAVQMPDTWTLVELRDEMKTLVEAASSSRVMNIFSPQNYLDATELGHFDVAMSNPPFSIAKKIIEKSLREADWVVMLLRQGFLGSARSPWLRNEMPDVYNLPERPSFIASYKCKGRDSSDHPNGCGWTMKTPVDAPRFKSCPKCGRDVQRSSSDSAEYSWAVWTPERGRKVGKVSILESTSDLERGVQRRRKKAA